MTFTLRSFLVAVAVVAVWLGTLVSGSLLANEVMTTLTILAILVTLPLAIWDSRQECRPFWAGFFVLSLGNLLLAHYPQSHHPSYFLTELTLTALESLPNSNVAHDHEPPSSVRTPNPSKAPWYFLLPDRLRSALAAATSLIAGVLGGWVTHWFARRNLPGASQ